jgi:adenylate cyclase
MVSSPDLKYRDDFVVDLAALAVLDAKIDGQVVGDAKFDFDELSQLSGWTLDELADVCVWSGTPAAAPGERVYTDLDLDGLKALSRLAEKEGLPNESVGALARSISYSMERLALTQVESIVHWLVKGGLSDTAARAAAADYAPTQSEPILEQIGVLWRRHYAAAIHRLTTETILLRGVSDDDRQFPLIVGVGYAKIADFSEVTAGFDVEGYASFVQKFDNQMSDIINSTGGRVVKLMGDTVVWVTPHAENSAEIALQMTQLKPEELDAKLRIGITWCRVMSFHGNIYGPGVNLASNLADLAPAGGIYLDDAAAGHFFRNSRFNVSPQPDTEIKGLGAVRPWTLTEA